MRALTAKRRLARASRAATASISVALHVTPRARNGPEGLKLPGRSGRLRWRHRGMTADVEDGAAVEVRDAQTAAAVVGLGDRAAVGEVIADQAVVVDLLRMGRVRPARAGVDEGAGLR